ncbi:unnamed protein product, partial [Anisakis simplex]|uniref:Peptidase_M1_N domain-containing protein n=1 Tax=Anisakis simplex TaxID=6269 RepID=A0A0M3KJK0_ANISI
MLMCAYHIQCIRLISVHIFYDFFVKKGDEPFSERLPKDIMPLTYDAFIQPYFPSSAHYDWTKNMTFDSTINVTMRVITATDKVNISVHRLLIQPTDIHLADMTGATLEYSKVIKDYDNGVMTIYLRNQLPVDSVFYLFIKSVGYIFYGASEGAYTNFGIFEFNGKMAWIFSTDDESGPDIRSVWPCFDEPYFKANWTVTIKHASDMIALCNMINTG